MNKLNKILAMSLATLALAGSSSPIFAGRVVRVGKLEDSRKTTNEKKAKKAQIQPVKRSNTFILKRADYQGKLELENKRRGGDIYVETIREYMKKRISGTVIPEEIYTAAFSIIASESTDDKGILKTAGDIISAYNNNLLEIENFKQLVAALPNLKSCSECDVKDYYDIIHNNISLIHYVLQISSEDDLRQAALDMLSFEKSYKSNFESTEYESTQDED